MLIADDSPVTRYALERALRSAGIDALAASSLAEALRLDCAKVSCALLDLDLGDAQGTELAARLRERSPALPIAFFTASRAPQLARAFGPVFSKPEGLGEAVAWVAASEAAGAPR